MRAEAGFTLIEVVASLVIVGILAVFASLFLVVGLNSYEFTRKTADAAMSAEIALNRISLELKTINSIWMTPQTNSSLAYTSSDSALPGFRTMRFVSGNLTINTGGFNDFILIKDVSDPRLSVALDDLDGDGSVEVAYITVGFTLSGMPAFQVRVYPREMIDKTW